MSVAVVSCLYGSRYDQFVPGWAEAVAALDPAPDEVIVGSDRERDIPGGRVIVSYCPWRHPQAWHLNEAVLAAESDWIWIVDIDDRPFKYGRAGIENVRADVWVMGYTRFDGVHYEDYIPEVPASLEHRNAIPAGSAFRREAFQRAGGFPDVAFQDWALWRSLASAGATFEASGRTHYHYNRHEHTRSHHELTPERRAEHVEEMLRSEAAHVA